MEDQLISFETAKLAKEKGFPRDSCFNVYNENGELSYIDRQIKENEIDSPTQSLLQKWLREAHKLIVEVTFDCYSEYFTYNCFYLQSINKDLGWLPVIEGDDDENFKISNECDTYEEALEEGLKTALIYLKP